MAFTFAIRGGDLPKQLRGQVPRGIFQQEAVRAVNEISVLTRNRLVQVSPYGGTNQLRTSWIITPAVPVGRGVVGKVASTAIQAVVLDEGARPHRPPPNALDVWIRRKVGITNRRDATRFSFFVRKKIARRGLPIIRSKKGMFSKAVRALKPFAAARLMAMRNRIIARMGG